MGKGMNKKILICGSFLAVVLLVLVAFTSVVGFQSVKSSSAINSPLFNIRTQRAIDKESKGLTCDYVGKGKESILSIPKREDRGEFIQKLVKMFGEMDKIEVRRVLVSIVRMINEKDMICNENIYEVEKILSDLKSNPNAFYTESESCMTSCCFTFIGSILCLIWDILIIILTVVTLNLALLILVMYVFFREIGKNIPFTYLICN